MTTSVILFLWFFIRPFHIWCLLKQQSCPFHKWLPAAMVAPTPVSALLHAVAVVKAGVFLVIKISIYIFGILEVENINISGFITFISSFTIIAASFVALYSDNLKRRLAYSTISQLSYIVLATSLSNFFGIIAAIFHLVAHAFGKITFSLQLEISILRRTKPKFQWLELVEMPFTLLCFLIDHLSWLVYHWHQDLYLNGFLFRELFNTRWLPLVMASILSSFEYCLFHNFCL